MRNDRALLAEQGVEQRRLAHVGAPHDRKREFGLVGRNRAFGRQALDDRVEQIARPLAVQRRDDNRFAESQSRELAGHLQLDAFRFGLVRGQDHRPARLAHDVHDVVVERRKTGRGVDDEDDDVGFVCRDLGLGARLARHIVAAAHTRIDTGGVDDAERASVPLDKRVKPVAGDAGFVVDDRKSLAREPVEERAFAHVRASDDGHGRGAHFC